jgi:hypothetical protein
LVLGDRPARQRLVHRDHPSLVEPEYSHAGLLAYPWRPATRVAR